MERDRSGENWGGERRRREERRGEERMRELYFYQKNEWTMSMIQPRPIKSQVGIASLPPTPN